MWTSKAINCGMNPSPVWDAAEVEFREVRPICMKPAPTPNQVEVGVDEARSVPAIRHREVGQFMQNDRCVPRTGADPDRVVVLRRERIAR